jgi:hypothetical protein
MADTPSTESETETESSAKKDVPFPPWWKSPRVVNVAALAIAMIAVAIAIAAWFRPEGQSFNDQQTAQAKKDVCLTYNTVRQGVVVNTNLADPVPNDAIGQLAVAANARLALLGGGAYLRDRVAAEPATPADLAQAVKSIADTSEQLGSAYLANADAGVVDPLRHNLDGEISQANKLCAA